MRIRRIRLANYRGVREREVVLPQRNVTVIEGPNESGKSSLNEALDVILDYYDSSKAAPILDLKPTNADAGTEIEIDVEAGAYAFTYAKRFHKRTETTLTVRKPQQESLTGRDAHDRVLAILAETVDLGLWRALRIQQGLEVDLPQLAENPSLARALDDAAGHARAGDRELGLLQAVEEEYERYYTPRERQPTELLRRAQAALATAAERVADLEAQLAAVDTDAQACERLRREIDGLEQQRRQRGREVEQQHAAQLEAERLRATVAELRRKRDAARGQLRQAQLETERRRQLAALLGELGGERAWHDRARDDREPTFAAARDKLERAMAALRKRDEALRAARAAFDAQRRRLDGLRDERDLDDLRRRLTRARELRQRIAAQRAELEQLRVDDEALARIRSAHVEMLGAEVRARESAPQIELRARRDLHGSVNGTELRLDAGQSLQLPRAQRLHLDLDDVLELSLTPGAGSEARAEALLRARAAFAEACRTAGVEDLDAALAAHAQAARARQQIELLHDELGRALQGATIDELDAQMARLVPRVDGERRAPEAQDVEAARRQTDACHAEVTRREAERREVEREVAGLREVRDKLEHEQGRDLERIALLEQRQHEEAAALDSARSQENDAALASRVARLETECGGVEAELAQRQAELEQADPDNVEALAVNSRRVLEQLDADLDSRRTKHAEVRARIDVRLEAGCHDALGRARADLHRAQLEHDTLQRRAAAAARLRDTLRRHRDGQLLGYRAPLRERIEKLGRLLFGPTFGIELDEQLRITSRTLHDVTVPFRSLSVGTQEQLSIMARLACAMLVARDGGVPVILDDVLGYCDPDRLRAMGSMLAVAGRECQIILLTCDPERGRQVGGAHVVRIAEAESG